MPILNGIEAARQIRRTNQHVRIVFLTMHSDVVYASEAFQAGGIGLRPEEQRRHRDRHGDSRNARRPNLLTPSLDQHAVETQIQRSRGSRPGIDHLPPRQREVLQMAAEGHSTKAIADALGISPRTVEFHRYQAMKTLDLHTIAELVQYAIKHHLVAL